MRAGTQLARFYTQFQSGRLTEYVLKTNRAGRLTGFDVRAIIACLPNRPGQKPLPLSGV